MCNILIDDFFNNYRYCKTTYQNMYVRCTFNYGTVLGNAVRHYFATSVR